MNVSEAYVIPDNHNIKWIAYQLANDHQIEKTDAEVYWQVFNDAGRDEFKAGDMLHELAENKIALSSFAQSLNAVDRPAVQYVTRYRGPDSAAVGMMVTVGILIGYLAGLFL